MNEYLEIKVTNSLLVLKENELMQCLALKPDVFESAIKRGKGRIRASSASNRQVKSNAQGFDRWQLYELLKGNRNLDETAISWIEGMNSAELREGVIEFLLSRNRNG